MSVATPLLAAERDDQFDAVDAVFAVIAEGIQRAGLEPVVEIDHARLADKAGETMPPSRVILFVEPAVLVSLLRESVRTGLDLPWRVLSYYGERGPRVLITDSAFLRARHGITDEAALTVYDHTLDQVLDDLATPVPNAVPAAGLVRDYGILSLDSDYDFAETVARLADIVAAQDDTVWFGDIDYTALGAKLGVTLPAATLLLFGGPGPGAVAMRDFPKLGLDAFCQKLLVYEQSDGRVRVIYNSIADLAKLHYGKAARPHLALDERLTATFSQAVTRP